MAAGSADPAKFLEWLFLDVIGPLWKTEVVNRAFLMVNLASCLNVGTEIYSIICGSTLSRHFVSGKFHLVSFVCLFLLGFGCLWGFLCVFGFWFFQMTYLRL